jgi:hypothetical protein
VTAAPAEFVLRPPEIRRDVAAKSRYVTGLEPADIEALFSGGVRVRLCHDQRTRWLMRVSLGGAWARRKDFASPYAEHACRTAEHWYGPPVAHWRAVDESEERNR